MRNEEKNKEKRDRKSTDTSSYYSRTESQTGNTRDLTNGMVRPAECVVNDGPHGEFCRSFVVLRDIEDANAGCVLQRKDVSERGDGDVRLCDFEPAPEMLSGAEKSEPTPRFPQGGPHGTEVPEVSDSTEKNDSFHEAFVKDLPLELFECYLLKAFPDMMGEKPELVLVSAGEEESVMDSGSSHVMSRERSDFTQIAAKPTVRLVAVSGKVNGGRPVGYLGEMKENRLGIRPAVYYPHLPVKRIVGTKILNSLLWGIHLLPGEGTSHIQSYLDPADIMYLTEGERGLPALMGPLFGKRKIAKRQLQFGVLQRGGEKKTEQNPDAHTLVAATNKLQRHRRRAHLHIPGEKVRCGECDAAKGEKIGSQEVRPPAEHPQHGPLSQCNVDFYGPMPLESVRGNKLLFVVICDAIPFVWVFGVRRRSECVSIMKNLIGSVRALDGKTLTDKIIYAVRSDNDSVFRSAEWDRELRKLGVEPMHSVPYNPTQNGVVERFMRTLGQNLRACLFFVDKRLFCYAGEFIAWTWNRTERAMYPRFPELNGKAPIEARQAYNKKTQPQDVEREQTPEKTVDNDMAKNEKGHTHGQNECVEKENEHSQELENCKVMYQQRGNRWEKHMRRFGCLVHFLIQPREKVPKLAPKARKGVFLGYSKNNSAWLCGTYVEDERYNGGLRWAEFETRDCKFAENVMVSDIEQLKPGSGKFILDEDVFGGERGLEEGEPVVARESEPTRADPTPGCSVVEKKEEQAEEIDDKAEKVEDNAEKTEDPAAKTSGGVNEETSSKSCKRRRDSSDEFDENANATSTKTVDGVVRVYGEKRQRGRPKGAKDLKKRVRRWRRKPTPNDIENADEMIAAVLNATVEHDGEDEDEEFEEATVQISVAAALRSSDAPKWLEAVDREKLKLEAAKTWRPLTREEMTEDKQVVPVAILLTRKRDGTYKARAVALGNQVRGDEDLEVYSPVVTAAGNRYMITAAAAEGDHAIAFDIDCAFLNAELGEKVFVRLPDQWADAKESPVRRLLKALYGLKQSPRAWFKRYEVEMKKVGWGQCPEEPGLWRKRSEKCPGKYMKASVYVDDNFATGPDYDELSREVARILEVFPGKITHPRKIEGGWLQWDMLGSDLFYNREQGKMKISMGSYIQKVLKKFNLEDAKVASTPCFDESNLTGEQAVPAPGFPFRQLVGCLQWIVTIARPDVCLPVNALARCMGKPVSRAMVTAGKKVLRYLKGTPDEGPSYSPQQEGEFKELYGKLLQKGREAETKIGDHHIFSDASFASCSVAFRSISGSVLYYRSVPVLWKSARQSVRAYSTMEAEWIAASDALVLTRGIGFLGFFQPVNCEDGKMEEPKLWVDNESAITAAKSPDLRPKSRHFVLRYHRVRDEAARLCFAPTSLQKADGLTKMASERQRRLIFHVNPIDAGAVDRVEEEECVFASVFLAAAPAEIGPRRWFPPLRQ